ncbi:phosphatase PAP2 family protein [Comamonas sp. 4034]|uniref:phosphatase PAP2 family protein n=1 Tax=Comamonas sp. 4034 TaxID=3156455 RepID=UPI003D22BD05
MKKFSIGKNMFIDASSEWFEIFRKIQNASIVNFNHKVFEFIAGGYHPNLLTLTIACFLAKYGGWLAYAGAIGSIWGKSSRSSYIFFAILVSGLAAVAAHSLADYINHPRPFMLGLSPAYVTHSARGSFPSAHATVLWSLGFIYLLRTNIRWTGGWIIICALMTSWGRVYTGLHFPIDIIGGIILGSIIALLFGSMNFIASLLANRFRSTVDAPYKCKS